MIRIPANLKGRMPPGNPHGPLDVRRQARRDLIVRLRVEEHWTMTRIAEALGLNVETVRQQLMKAGAGGRRAKNRDAIVHKQTAGVTRIGTTRGDLPDPSNPPPSAA